jgi:opacity protein-like surface antigen
MPLPQRRVARLGQVTAIAVASFLFSITANAQVPTSGNVFFGYSFYNTDLSSTNRSNLNGWEGSVEGKVFPFVGLVVDVSGHYGSQDALNPAATCAIGVTCSPLHVSTSIQNFLFGPRVSFSVGKIRPFAEALFGGGHVNADSAGSDTSFATALGGGIDYKIIRPVALRVQGDYVQTRFFGATQNNLRLSTGIVFRF